MHSYIFQVSTKPFNADEGYELTEDNAVDYNAGRVDYAYPCEDYEKAVRHLMENILPKGMFTLVTIPSEDEDSDPTYTLRYEGGFEEWAKQYVENIQAYAREVNVDNVLGWHSKSYDLRNYIDNPLNTMCLFCDTDSLNGEDSGYLMEIVKHLKVGDILYFPTILGYHS